MRVVALMLLAGALTIGAAGSASAGCTHDCDGDGYWSEPSVGYRAVPGHYDRSFYGPYRSEGCRSYRGYGCRPALIYGGPQNYTGPVYSTTGHYHHGPYVSHRANLGYGGCRTAYLAVGPTWQLASNC